MKKISSYLIGHVLYFMIINSAFSQTTIPVDPLTGRAQVTIPLHSMTRGSLSDPIVLVYNGGGIKVTDTESNAGIGWSLVAGGSVSREVRGLPDDVDDTPTGRKGWLYSNAAGQVGAFSSTSDDNLTVCGDELNDWNFILNAGYTRDTEPDVFYFNAPGLSGRFVFDNGATPQARIIPYQDLKLTVTRDPVTNQIIKFEIVNNLGVKYEFSRIEKITRQTYPYRNATINYFKTLFNYYATKLTYTAAWHLTKIESHAGEILTYGYSTGPNSISYDYKRIVRADNSAVDTLYSIKTESDPVQLSSIGDNGLMVASFVWDGGLVSSVDITESGYLKSKRFSFHYRWVKQSNDVPTTYYKRAFLKEIKEELNCNAFPSHEFEYYAVYFGNDEGGNTIFPIKDKSAQDYFGYFNSMPGTLVPEVHYNDAASDGERYRLYSKAGHLVSTGAYRKISSSSIYYASLMKINYPAGGFSQVYYEPNDYFDGDSTRRGPGIRVKNVRISDGDADTTNNIVTHYDYRNGTNSSGKILYQPSFAFSNGTGIVKSPVNLAPDETVLYGKVTIKQTGRGKTVYDYLVPAAYPETLNSDFQASKSKLARQACANPTQIKNGFYSYPFAANTNWDFERGLPFNVATYNEAGAKLTEKSITYQRITSAVVTIKGLKFEAMDANNVFNFSTYTFLSQVDKVVRQEKT